MENLIFSSSFSESHKIDVKLKTKTRTYVPDSTLPLLHHCSSHATRVAQFPFILCFAIDQPPTCHTKGTRKTKSIATTLLVIHHLFKFWFLRLMTMTVTMSMTMTMIMMIIMLQQDRKVAQPEKYRSISINKKTFSTTLAHENDQKPFLTFLACFHTQKYSALFLCFCDSRTMQSYTVVQCYTIH